MNKETAKRLKDTAQRTINIVALLMEGKTPREVVSKLACDRQLVEYYKKLLSKKK
jgi:hypothetical protein